MNTKHLQKHFEDLGVQFTARSHEQVHHLGEHSGWRHHIHRPELRVQARNCVLVYEDAFQDELAVSVRRAGSSREVLILTIGYFNTEVHFLCQVHEERLVTQEITARGPRALEDQIAAFQRQIKPAKSRKKRKRQACALSYTAANQRVPMTEAEYEAYITLAEACRKTKFVAMEGPVVRQYGPHETNTYRTALMRIATCHKQWLRAPAAWKAGSRNPDKAFRDLLHHLFGHYPVPEFLATVWFRRRVDWIPCYIAVSQGAPIRKAPGFTFPFTKKMAHHMMNAPARFTMEEAIRWGQIQGLGGNERFFAAIQATRMTPVFRNNPKGHAFWQTVLAWFLQYPMLDTAHFGPLVDYIRQEKRRNPNFTMAGRSPKALLRAMETWHAALNAGYHRDTRVPATWQGHQLDWWWSETEPGGLITDWRLVEITSAERLREEGITMKHCVSTYHWGCAKGRVAICSLQRNGVPRLTVEYLPNTHEIGEVRGKTNRVPSTLEWRILNRWAATKRLG